MTRKTVPAHVEIVCDRCKRTIHDTVNRIVMAGHKDTMPVTLEYDFCDPCMRSVVAVIDEQISWKETAV